MLLLVPKHFLVIIQKQVVMKSEFVFLGVKYCKIVPSDINVRKFHSDIEWNRKFPECCFENSFQALEVVYFRGNLKIPAINLNQSF